MRDYYIIKNLHIVNHLSGRPAGRLDGGGMGGHIDIHTHAQQLFFLQLDLSLPFLTYYENYIHLLMFSQQIKLAKT